MKKQALLFILSIFIANQASAQGMPAPAVPDPQQAQARIEEIEAKLSAIEKKLNELKSLRTQMRVPLDQPIWLSEEVLAWTKGAIVETYTYNYENYKQILENIRPYFTKDGYDSYMKALQASGNLAILDQKKMVVTAQLNGDAKVLQYGAKDGIYRWQVQVPLTVNYQDIQGVVKQSINVNLDVVRVNDEEHPKGIGIHSITAESATPPAAAASTTTTTTTVTKP